MDIMKMFRDAAAPKPVTSIEHKPAPADTPAPNADPTKGATNPDGSPINPNDLKKNPAGTPFDNYQQIFDNAAKNSGIQAPTFSLDPKIVSEVASKMDFTQGINQELLAKASAGDVSSLVALIQDVGRNSYKAAIEHNTKLVDTHLTQRAEYEAKNLKEGVRQQMTNDALTSGDNANLNHPVVRAELNNIANRLARAPEYADASPQKIADAAKQYFLDLHEAMNPSKPTKNADGSEPLKTGEVDNIKTVS